MPCYACTKEFGIFNREHGCSNCGFGFCSNCVDYRSVVPRKGGGKEVKVCSSCYNILNNPEKAERVYAPPEALQKRLDSLGSPGGPPVIVYTENRKMSSLRRGMSAEDQKIVDRLQKLQKERKESSRIPSDSEIAERLSKLKDEPVVGESKPGVGTPFYKPADKRSDIEKSRDLLEGVMKEVEIDSTLVSPEMDITLRLAKLRGQDPELVKQSFNRPVIPDPVSFLTKSNQVDNFEDLDLDEVSKLLDIVGRDVENEAIKAVKELEKDKAIQDQLAKLKVRCGGEKDTVEVEDEEEEDSTAEEKLIQQLLAEKDLEERLGLMDDSIDAKPVKVEEKDLEPEELPWCVICNEDAAIRCVGCDNDLYCRSCFKEFHAGENPKEHKTFQFKN